ncbi:MAG TPA: hypothetical protein PLC27_15160 [Saprospiraceae bacterium]|nr:hypothetical protein [Saprospiraceae bacterium]
MIGLQIETLVKYKIVVANFDYCGLLKTAKKQGVLPEDILIDMLKLNKPIQEFEQESNGLFHK